MKSAKDLTRLWNLLVRVRRLRVERKRRALTDARARMQEACAETAARRDAIDRHAAQRAQVVDACAHDRRAANLWRSTLQLHDARSPALHDALAAAQRRERTAEAEMRGASKALQREMQRCEDAQTRVREARARVVDEA